MRILGLIAGFLGAIITVVGGLMAWELYQQVPVFCPDDPACGDARTAVWIAAGGAVSGLVTFFVGMKLRQRAG